MWFRRRWVRRRHQRWRRCGLGRAAFRCGIIEELRRHQGRGEVGSRQPLRSGLRHTALGRCSRVNDWGVRPDPGRPTVSLAHPHRITALQELGRLPAEALGASWRHKTPDGRRSHLRTVAALQELGRLPEEALGASCRHKERARQAAYLERPSALAARRMGPVWCLGLLSRYDPV